MARTILAVLLANLDRRVDEIARDLVDAPETVSFFCIMDHGISKEGAASAFLYFEVLFALSCGIKKALHFHHHRKTA